MVVTGFLGSGKTTLVNRLLARRAARGGAASGKKLGVIVNELGEIGIDGTLLGGEGARQVELPGGCVCCVLGDELDRTLIDLVERNPELEGIILETSGAAEPLPIAWAVARAPVDRVVRLATVVSLVDALNFTASRPVSVAVDAQVAYGDVVLVTKAELADAATTAAALTEVRSLAPHVAVRIGSTDDHAAWIEEIMTDPDLERPSDSTHVHTDACRHVDSHAAHGIDSVWALVPDVVDLEELEDQLADLPGNYVRIKGIIQAIDGRVDDDAPPRWVVIHRVGLRVSSEPIVASAGERGRIVALGPGVAVGELEARISAARAPASDLLRSS